MSPTRAPTVPGPGRSRLPATGPRTRQADARGCLIEARDLVRSFGETPALRGTSVSVASGEILAVMGPSGSGKSTLLHCLAGILVPEAGEVRFAGQRVDTLAEAERSALRRDHFGFVFQFAQLVPELSAVETGMSQRKRPFALLRLTGVPLGVLRRVVTLEAGVPLLTIAVVATGTGLLSAELFLESALGLSLRPPGFDDYLIVSAGLAISLAIIATTFPLVARITAPELARSE